MSNREKTDNFKVQKDLDQINLGDGKSTKSKRQQFLPKLQKNNPHTIIKDISTDGKGGNNIYLKIKPNKYYGFVSNLLKIIVVGSIILLAINSVNIYLKGMKAKDLVMLSAETGYSKLLEGSKSTTKIEFAAAKESFNSALENFKDAEKTLWFISQDKTIYSQKTSLASSSMAILNSGKYFASAGEYFLGAIEELNKIPLYFVSKNDPLVAAEAKGDVTPILKAGVEKATLALEETRKASEELDRINQDLLPPELLVKFKYAKDKIAQVIKTLESMKQYFPAILKLLGEKYNHTYLLLFQNNAEARPTGGFIGSYAIVNVNDGVIENIKVEDVYKLDDLYTEIIPAPEYLAKYSPNFLFRNSNYSPDFFFSGKNAAWILQKEGGPSVDTVIALNQSLLQEFLEVTGPLQVGELPGKLTADNYEVVLTYIIEGKIWGKEDPKRVLKLMVPEFQKALLKKENVSKIMGILYKAAEQKMIMAYSRDAEIEAFFDTLGISGRVQQLGEKEDYLNVIQVSMGGTKTDPLIEQKITHNTEVNDDGSLIDTVTISRKHMFDNTYQDKWNKMWDEFGFDHKVVPGFVVDMLGRGADYVNTRLIVPEGSKLIGVEGITLDQVQIGYDKDLGKTYFLTEMRVLPQIEVSITLKYSLPFKLDFSPLDTYKLIVQKQPGSKGSIFTKNLEVENEESKLAPYAYYPEEAVLASSSKVSYATDLSYDRYFSTVLGE